LSYRNIAAAGRPYDVAGGRPWPRPRGRPGAAGAALQRPVPACLPCRCAPAV